MGFGLGELMDFAGVKKPKYFVSKSTDELLGEAEKRQADKAKKKIKPLAMK